MSTKPNPVALTAARLCARMASPACLRTVGTTDNAIHLAARLASDLHRLAKGCQRHAIAMCNGEWLGGQRDHIMRVVYNDEPEGSPARRERISNELSDLDDSIAAYGARLDRRIAKLNAKLAPLSLVASRHGDPRGIVLRLTAADGSAPIPRNGMGDDSWGIA